MLENGAQGFHWQKKWVIIIESGKPEWNVLSNCNWQYQYGCVAFIRSINRCRGVCVCTHKYIHIISLLCPQWESRTKETPAAMNTYDIKILVFKYYPYLLKWTRFLGEMLILRLWMVKYKMTLEHLASMDILKNVGGTSIGHRNQLGGANTG